jgi:hypothetical protein
MYHCVGVCIFKRSALSDPRTATIIVENKLDVKCKEALAPGAGNDYTRGQNDREV